jgi:hypothetical protein
MRIGFFLNFNLANQSALLPLSAMRYFKSKQKNLKFVEDHPTFH